MRKIEQAMVTAIRAGKDWRAGSTAVHHDPVIGGCEVEVRLHGNLIAKRFYRGESRPGEWQITLAGWNTVTTRSRLNALANAFGSKGGNVYTRKGQPYIGGRKVSCTEWVTI